MEMAQTTAAHGAGAPLFHGDSFCFISNFKVMIMMNLLESVDFLISYNAFGGLLLLGLHDSSTLRSKATAARI